MEKLHLNEALEQFLLYLQYRKGRSETTITTYRSILGFFIDYTGNRLTSELTVKEIDNYAMSLTVLGLAPKTYRNRIVPIRSFFQYLYKKDLTSIRPDKIDVPPDPEQEADFLDPEEQAKLLAACQDQREKALIECLLRSGVRVSELTNAKCSDLYNRSLVISHGKGNKARVTFITKEAESALKKYHRSLSYKPIYLFTNSRGAKLSRQYVHRMVVTIAERASIEKPVSPHTLRHTFATNLLMNGARAEDVQPMMGHKNIRTTLMYMHFTNKYLHERYDQFSTAPLT